MDGDFDEFVERALVRLIWGHVAMPSRGDVSRELIRRGYARDQLGLLEPTRQGIVASRDILARRPDLHPDRC